MSSNDYKIDLVSQFARCQVESLSHRKATLTVRAGRQAGR
jgi:hypothetical protein